MAIHGAAWKVDYVDDVVVGLREYISFDLCLAEEAENFELLKQGWQKDHCAICRWELIETSTDASYSEGYTKWPRLAMYRMLREILGPGGVLAISLP